MKSVLKISPFILAAGFLISNTALAYGYIAKPIPPRNSFYIDGNVGYSNLSTPNKNLCDPNDLSCPFTSVSYNTDGVGACADVGYRFAINPAFLIGSELGYDYNGQSKYSGTYYWDGTNFSATVKSQDVHLLGTGAWLFPNGVNLFAKAGAARVNQSLSYDNNEYNYGSASTTEFKPMTGVGVGYQNGLFDINLQYSHIFGTNVGNFSDAVDTNGNMKIVSVDAIKLGLGVIIPVL
jgi:hypothetical protein